MKTAKFPAVPDETQPETISVRTLVGEFALQGLESCAVARGAGVSELISEAMTFYLGARRARPPGSAFPGFASAAEDRQVALEAEVVLDAVVWERFKREAAAQGVAVGQLLGHALLFYLADLDRR
jgi:hypothetical protein